MSASAIDSLTLEDENARLLHILKREKINTSKSIPMEDTLTIPTEITESTSTEAEEFVQLLDDVSAKLSRLRQLVNDQPNLVSAVRTRPRVFGSITPTNDEDGMRVIEGAFDGQNMVGPDGKQYSVPANYASKSKLVEGDVLKLTITRDGSFIYKQIGPIERQRLIGQLIRDDATGEFKVMVDGRPYKVLLASITYFKGDVGDEVVILVPQNGETRWAAVENIIKHGSTDADTSLV